MRRWAGAGADLIVGGHIHLPFVLALHERWPGLSQPLWAVQAGTAVSHRVRKKADNSVNVIRVGAAARSAQDIDDAVPRCCVIERWDHVAVTQRFERTSAQRLGNSYDT